MSNRGIHWQEGNERVRTRVGDWVESGSELMSECLHESPQRSLHRLDQAATPSVVLKIHHTKNGRHRLREAIKAGIGYSPVAREWGALTRLHAAGVPVPEPLARGVLPNGDAFLVMEYLEGPDILSHLGRENECSAWIDRLADSVAMLHAKGFRHGDLHLGNLRVHHGRVMILDLQRARRAWGRREQLRDLAHLDFSIARRGFDVECRRRLRRALGDPAGHDAASRRFVRDFLRGRSRRELRIGRNWQRWQFRELIEDATSASIRTFEGLRARDIEMARLENALGEAIRDPSTGDRRGGRTRITRHGDQDGSGPLIVKRMIPNRGREAFVDRLRGSSALRSFRRGQRLSLLGSLGARTFAALEERRAGHRASTWLILESVGRFDLDEYQPASEEDARRCSVALARWIAEWHAWGIEHLDLKAGNIRIDDRNGEFRFWLIDLVDIRFRRRLSDAARRRALAQLNASIADDAFPLSARLAALDDYVERLPFRNVGKQESLESIARLSQARNHRWRGVGCQCLE
jgi:tRNA A-37 threonylcarbamoyl transferase component Bud32